MSSPARKLTYDDLLRLPEDRFRHELIDGRHRVSPAPNIQHQKISHNLALALGQFVRERRLGWVFESRTDVLLSATDVVEPDLLFVSTARAGMIGEQCVQGAPDLVVEILSPGTRSSDEGEKRELYERSGVAEYWVVNPEAEAVQAWRLQDGRFRDAGRPERARGEMLTTPLLPGLRVSLEDLFAEG